MKLKILNNEEQMAENLSGEHKFPSFERFQSKRPILVSQQSIVIYDTVKNKNKKE